MGEETGSATTHVKNVSSHLIPAERKLDPFHLKRRLLPAISDLGWGGKLFDALSGAATILDLGKRISPILPPSHQELLLYFFSFEVLRFSIFGPSITKRLTFLDVSSHRNLVLRMAGETGVDDTLRTSHPMSSRLEESSIRLIKEASPSSDF
ncbi:hypothetical protein CEXT_548251 [Caerostris extrusa]|uniref:Uncharacterized protein n=1 Tax=Caerostris extrusa TaxID=172846 RepID=A0AAV4PBB1_CAEEX|nr:hypothetical protein CEXT_548251 [Caerostris extrusa]